MIEVKRIHSILKTHNLTPTSIGRMVHLSHSKMSKVMTGEQTLPSAAVGIIIKELGIDPNWLFGFEGDPEIVRYMKDLIHKSEVEKLEAKIRELKDELGEVYKQLAEERRVK